MLILNASSLSFTSVKFTCNIQGSLKSPVSQQLESKAFDTENEKLNENEAKKYRIKKKRCLIHCKNLYLVTVGPVTLAFGFSAQTEACASGLTVK